MKLRSLYSQSRCGGSFECLWRLGCRRQKRGAPTRYHKQACKQRNPEEEIHIVDHFYCFLLVVSLVVLMVTVVSSWM